MSKPVKKIQCGRGASVAIWDNGDKGHAVTLTGPQYQDGQGNWKEGQIFLTDLPGIIRGLERAMVFIENRIDAKERGET